MYWSIVTSRSGDSPRGCPLRQLDARWELPSDIPTTLAAIQDDISRLDECSLSDWQVERANVRALLVRMKALIAAAT